MLNSERTARLKLREKVGYALGDAGFNFYWVLIGSWLSYFYTDVFGLAPAAAGTMFLVTKIVDAFTDPAMGAIADRTETRWGKFRPYMLFGGIPLGAAGILTMSTPDLSEGGKLIWAYGTYTLLMLCYTIVNTPYSSLAGVITADANERNSVFGIRFFFAFATGTIVGMFTRDLAIGFGGGDEAKGWQITMALYAVIATICFLVTFASSKERVKPPASQNTHPLRDIKDLLNNRPWIVLFALAMIIMMTIVFRGSSSPYYFKYFVERPDLMGPYIGLQMAAYAVGCLLYPYMARVIRDKARLLMMLMGIVGVLSVVFSFVPKPDQAGVITVGTNEPVEIEASDLLGQEINSTDSIVWYEHKKKFKLFVEQVPLNETSATLSIEDGKDRAFSVILTSASGEYIDSSTIPKEIIWMFLLNIMISLALGPKSPLAWSMYADVADYGEWKNGRRATAMTFAAATFSQKLGGALGSAGVLWVLASVGYVANEIQTGASVSSIVWLQTWVPALFAFISIGALRFYDLSNKKLEQIQKELKEREDN